MSSIIIIQARTSSTRLPAKVLLPINGIPLAVLSAKRASNTGRPLLVATSKNSDDDRLCDILRDNGIIFFRGELHNTLERFVFAIENKEDDCVIVRLTADNYVPDGTLIDEVVQEYLEKNEPYMLCNVRPCGLPYGMSVEVTRAKYLREAATNTKNKYDQEHVMPYISRKYGVAYFTKYKKISKGHFRCTVDVLEDYQTACSVFKDVKDPFRISSFELINKLSGLKYQPIAKKPVNKLVFGAAQLGTAYGIANAQGRPTQNEAEHMIKVAISNGVEYIDTAQAYGVSETCIGNSLEKGWSGRVKVITKLHPFCFRQNESPESIRNEIDLSISQSLSNLNLETIEVLMLHRASHLTYGNGIIWKHLQFLQKYGKIKNLGISIQSPVELKESLENPLVSFIQMPFNLLDYRWENLEHEIISTKKKRKLHIHVRSVFLQGLLLSDELAKWECAGIKEPKTIIQWLEQKRKLFGCDKTADLCLAYVRSKLWIDGVVLGMESANQLEQNIRSFDESCLGRAQVLKVEKTRPRIARRCLDPSNWKLA